MREVALLDIGNTRTRIALAGDGAPRLLRTLPTVELTPDALPRGLPIAACCVVPAVAERLTGVPIHFLTSEVVPPELLRLDRVDASTLGADRLANAIEAAACSAEPVAVFDFGTAITAEVVVARAFRGGAILPGRRLQRLALARNTAQLPELPLHETAATEAGVNTAGAIAFGVDRGVLGAVRELAAALRTQWGPSLRLWATGGDARFFLAGLPELTAAGADFTLRGLVRWYRAIDGRND